MEMSPNPFTIFTDDYPFNIGKAYSLRDGKDATIVATGYMVTEAIKAVDLLEKEGLDVGVLNVSTLKPLDEEAIIAAAERTGAIVTAENSSDINGLGDAVACALEREPAHAAGQGGRGGRVRPVRADHAGEGRTDGALRLLGRRPRRLGEGVHRQEREAAFQELSALR